MTTPNNWYLSCQAVREKIIALAITEFPTAKVLLQDVADDKGFASLPGVSVSPYGAETIDPNAGGNAFDDPSYPVLVGILDSKDPAKASSLATRLLWRETMITGLHHKNGSDFTVSSSAIARQYDTVVVPGSVTNLQAWERGVWASIFTVKVYIRRLHV